jgi:hypothetical protein
MKTNVEFGNLWVTDLQDEKMRRKDLSRKEKMKAVKAVKA